MDRRQRVRRAGPEAPRPPEPVPTGARSVSFSITMAGWGAVGVFDYTPAVDEIASIKFTSLCHGRIKVTVGDVTVLDTVVGNGPASITGLALPKGLRVGVTFSNTSRDYVIGGTVRGTVKLEPFAPKPKHSMSRERACEILGLPLKHTHAELQKAYRKAAMKHHPDHGGDQAEMVRVNEARAVLSADPD